MATDFDRDGYRRERQSKLERRVEFLEHENTRLLRVLGVSLGMLSAKTGMTDGQLLAAIEGLCGENFARAAVHDENGGYV